MVKTLLLTLLAVVAVVGLSDGAISHYDQYKNVKLQEAKAAATKQADEVTQAVNAVQTKYNQLSQAYVSLQAECQKGVTAYDTLPAAYRAKVPAPSCQAE